MIDDKPVEKDDGSSKDDKPVVALDEGDIALLKSYVIYNVCRFVHINFLSKRQLAGLIIIFNGFFFRAKGRT